MFKQNRGEWSELYVFLKLLGDGIIFAADADLNKIPTLYYPLVSIIRNENNRIKEYKNNSTQINITDELGNLILSLPINEFKNKANTLLQAIKASKDTTFNIPEIEEFMKLIQCYKVKADSKDKSDITVVLHDNKTYNDSLLGFSIKSKLGKPSTLLNSGKSTNFVYEISEKFSKKQVNEINKINSKSKVRDRLNKIKECGFKIKYVNMENEIFKSNLQMIDIQFPKIIADYLEQYYLGNGKLISDLTSIIKKLNPCNLNTQMPHKYYEYKMKNFLTDIALGMTPAQPWTGEFQATGGYIIVKEDGEILCYHIYNHNEFQEYLFRNTKLETPSSSRHEFGKIYIENNKYYIKLNLQIRFI